jgi:hypothetical protein
MRSSSRSASRLLFVASAAGKLAGGFKADAAICSGD